MGLERRGAWKIQIICQFFNLLINGGVLVFETAGCTFYRPAQQLVAMLEIAPHDDNRAYFVGFPVMVCPRLLLLSCVIACVLLPGRPAQVNV